METVDAEDDAKASGHGPGSVLAALVNWRVWYFALIYFCIQIATYGFTFFLPAQVTSITGQKLGFAASLVTAIPWLFGLIAVAFIPGIADRTRKHRPIGAALLRADRRRARPLRRAERQSGVRHRRTLRWPRWASRQMQPIFWTLPTEYMTGYAVAAGIGLVNSIGNLGGFLAPNMRSYFNATIGGNAGLYSLAVAAVIGAILFALTGLFKKANEIEAGHLDEVDATYAPH